MSLLETAVGWVAPVVCIVCGTEGEALCTVCSASEIIPFGERCWQCAALSPRSRTCPKCRHDGSPQFVWTVTDYGGTAKDLVQKYKFEHQRAASKTIAALMAETFHNFNTNEDMRLASYVIVPVPTATGRVRERGFDHAALLGERLAQQLGLQCVKALGRIGQERQVGTSRTARLAQARENYFVKNSEVIKGRNVLLVDDVVTTGATLQATAKALRRAGARRVDALVFAKRL